MQEQLEGCKRNRSVFEKIAMGMTAAGFQRTASQCRDRIKKLKKDYKKVKDYHSETGRERKQCKYYELLNDILGNKPSIKPAVVIDTLAPPNSSSELVSSASACRGVGVDTPASMSTLVDFDAPDKTASTSTVVDVDASLSAASTSQTVGGNTVDAGTEELTLVEKGKETDLGDAAQESKMKDERKVKKRRLTRADKLERAMDSVMEKVLNSQKESDKMFMEMECKRMKMDERMLELENERRREDREFQLRLASMFCQTLHPFGQLPVSAPMPFAAPHYSPYPGSSEVGSSQAHLSSPEIPSSSTSYTSNLLCSPISPSSPPSMQPWSPTTTSSSQSSN